MHILRMCLKFLQSGHSKFHCFTFHLKHENCIFMFCVCVCVCVCVCASPELLGILVKTEIID